MLRRKVPRRTSAPGLPNPDNDLPLRYLAYPASGVVQCAEVATVEWFGNQCRSRPGTGNRNVYKKRNIRHFGSGTNNRDSTEKQSAEFCLRGWHALQICDVPGPVPDATQWRGLQGHPLAWRRPRLLWVFGASSRFFLPPDPPTPTKEHEKTQLALKARSPEDVSIALRRTALKQSPIPF